MPNWFWITPLATALIGWLLHRWAVYYVFSSRGPLLKKREQLTDALAKQAASLVSFTELEQKLTGSANMQKVMPVIEEHIDEFLRHRLKEAMPMIGMFIGEKTIQQLKSIFMKELEDIFPRVMTNYVGNLGQEFDIEKLVAEKINHIPSSTLSVTLKTSLASEITMMQWWGAICGFIIGLVQIFIFLSAR